jgi:hypothetical protein
MNVSKIKLFNHLTPNRHRYNVNTTSKITSIKRNYHIQKRSNTIRVKSFNNDIVTMSYFIGKGMIAFTFFYTSLNYFYYKRLREEYEEENKDDQKK